MRERERERERERLKCLSQVALTNRYYHEKKKKRQVWLSLEIWVKICKKV